MKGIRLFFGLVLAVGLAAPGLAWSLNDSEEPGSVLVFPKFIRGTVDTPDLATVGQPISPRTEIEISVSCPKGSTCTRDPLTGILFDRVRLRAHWVCGESIICQERDFDLFTTVNGTIYFNPENIFPRSLTPGGTTIVPVPPCFEGYLIVWVVDQFGRPIKYDALTGDAVIREDSNSAGAYNAIPIQASDNFGTGQLTDVDGDHKLDFNGAEYKEVTGKAFGTVRYNAPFDPVTGVRTVETYLTLLTLDVNSNRLNNPTFVDLNFYNEGEEVRSNSALFFCWGVFSLTDIDEGLVYDFSGLGDSFGRKGLLETGAAEKQAYVGGDSTGPVTLLGIIETKERDPALGTNIREYSYSLYNDSTPVPTTFSPNTP